jgi:hypothetical protein
LPNIYSGSESAAAPSVAFRRKIRLFICEQAFRGLLVIKTVKF